MKTRLDDPRKRSIFYMSLAVAMVTWVGLSLMFGGALGLRGIPHLVVTMLGLGVILGISLWSPAYQRIKSGHVYTERR